MLYLTVLLYSCLRHFLQLFELKIILNNIIENDEVCYLKFIHRLKVTGVLLFLKLVKNFHKIL